MGIGSNRGIISPAVDKSGNMSIAAGIMNAGNSMMEKSLDM